MTIITKKDCHDVHGGQSPGDTPLNTILSCAMPFLTITIVGLASWYLSERD